MCPFWRWKGHYLRNNSAKQSMMQVEDSRIGEVKAKVFVSGLNLLKY